MFDYSRLWIRLIWTFMFGAIAVLLILLFGRKLKLWERITGITLVVLFMLLAGGSTLKALINPAVETVVGRYESEQRQISFSPFELEYCFNSNNQKLYLELDPFSKAKIFNQDFTKGVEYTISYEKNSNLILAVSPNY